MTNLIKRLGRQTEADVNKQDFRPSEVHFTSGGTAVSATQVAEAMERWADTFTYCLVNKDFAEPLGTPVRLYKGFEDIHSFADSNGRVGH